MSEPRKPFPPAAMALAITEVTTRQRDRDGRIAETFVHLDAETVARLEKVADFLFLIDPYQDDLRRILIKASGGGGRQR